MKTRAIRGKRRKKQATAKKSKPAQVKDFYEPGSDVTWRYTGSDPIPDCIEEKSARYDGSRCGSV